jgi:hypothetical protein
VHDPLLFLSFIAHSCTQFSQKIGGWSPPRWGEIWGDCRLGPSWVLWNRPF